MMTTPGQLDAVIMRITGASSGDVLVIRYPPNDSDALRDAHRLRNEVITACSQMPEDVRRRLPVVAIVLAPNDVEWAFHTPPGEANAHR